ncbi:tryptophan-rich sensory protein [Tamlana sp. 2_MG-2023]|uniref:tryptophan-rich sensory protein n=1 Tax=unclassified Tamlana TaxID=2614803 RepID=UPI0026E3BE12|nr:MULTISPECIES: tryptophan-rich sensory protein [unclassified Tamlana]MDO6761088.1 tryptophan-rich sensory protein [Tamlana sp. 2_MG-2023]MDO6791579.1 tryptophan-rich sensory protein [Tamlana sp. 1_MG-2023]
MNKTLSILNLISVVVAVGINYVSQALRFNDTTISEMSNHYDNLFTPAPYAFSIWGLIYLGLFAYAVFQIRCAFKSSKSSEFITQTGYWFIIANTLNSFWVLAFVYDYIGLSVLLMFGILFSLIQIILKTNMERWDAPLPVIAFLWWPICLYTGWISVATIANISTYLTKLGWQGGFLSAENWTIIMIIVAALLNIIVVFTRNMREFAMVGVWALVAIFIRHHESNNIIAYTALIASIAVFAVISWHGYINRHKNPIFKKILN